MVIKLYSSIQSHENVPQELHWLHSSERAVYNEYGFEKKQKDWLLGRWTAKQALKRFLVEHKFYQNFHEVAILPADDGAPEVFYKGNPFGCIVTLSHSNGIGFSVVGLPSQKIGCDLEKIEPRSQAFINDYFTNSEVSIITDHDEKYTHLLANLIWSAKESVLKAIRTGLSIDTRQVIIDCCPCDDNIIWNTFNVSLPNLDVGLFGKWKTHQGFVYTVVSEHQEFSLVEM